MTENSHDLTPQPPGGQFLLYEAEDGQIKIDVRLEDETVRRSVQLMSQKSLACWIVGRKYDRVIAHSPSEIPNAALELEEAPF